jgi:hypothetical protein
MLFTFCNTINTVLVLCLAFLNAMRIRFGRVHWQWEKDYVVCLSKSEPYLMQCVTFLPCNPYLATSLHSSHSSRATQKPRLITRTVWCIPEFAFWLNYPSTLLVVYTLHQKLCGLLATISLFTYVSEERKSLSCYSFTSVSQDCRLYSIILNTIQRFAFILKIFQFGSLKPRE